MKCVKNEEKHIFHIYFLNMDISLIMKITGIKLAIHVAEIRLEGRVSQNFDIGLRFCFMLCRRLNFFKKNTKNHKSYPFFALK